MFYDYICNYFHFGGQNFEFFRRIRSAYGERMNVFANCIENVQQNYIIIHEQYILKKYSRHMLDMSSKYVTSVIQPNRNIHFLSFKKSIKNYHLIFFFSN